MKSKYAIVGGLAFSEESDMKKLSHYAKEGWILEKIVAGGFLYKLKKDEPKNIVYSLDYQNESTEEYFHMFLEAGWTKVISIGGKMHIFSAQEGTKPIYSERESELEKYATMKRTLKKGSIYSFISLVIFIILAVVLRDSFKVVSIITKLLVMANIVVFVFNFMPYLAYIFRVKNLEELAKNNGKARLKWNLCIYHLAFSIIFLWWSIDDIIKEKYFGAVLAIIVTLLNLKLSINYYKESKS